MSHIFEQYFKRNGHYPRLRLDNGYQRLLIEFAPGYVRIKTYPRGSEIHILRSTWIQLLKRSIPLAKKWSPHPDHDVPQAVHDYYLSEMLHLEELRSQKRARKRESAASGIDEADRRERQKARHARAVARAARRRSEGET